MYKVVLVAIMAVALVGCNSGDKTQDKKDDEIKIGASKTSTSKADLKASMERGQETYNSVCMVCHMPNGQGVTGTFPPLAGSDWLTQNREGSIQSVKYGQQGEIVVNGVTYNGVMAPLGLSDKEVADVLNFVMNSWENTQEKMVTEAEVAAVKK
jgi:mono/diheme cytochrome c family protein